MTTATMRHRGVRRSRALAAIAAGALLITAPLWGTLSAHAEPLGYVGTGDSYDTDPFDDYGGNRVLPIMTAGEPYTGTLTGPQYYPTDWCWSLDDGSLPGGITMSTAGGECAPTVTFSGTPEAGYFEFTLHIADTAGETNYYLTFEGTIESGKEPTTTAITLPEIAPYDAIPLSADVAADPAATGTPSGTVEFRTSDGVIGSATLSPTGDADTTGGVDIENAGSTLEVTAAYLGDTDFQGSSSTAATIKIYVPSASGFVHWNGTAVSGATVALLDVDDLSIVVDTDTTDADGEFTLTPPTPTTLADVSKRYLVRVTFSDSTVLYYAGETSVADSDDAAAEGPATWAHALGLYRTSGPVWSDSTLATPRVGAAYTDGVTASSVSTVAYTVSAGSLPAGLSLDGSTGAVTGTPGACGETCEYDFTIKADNGYGSITQRFTGELLPEAEPPTWEDDELVAFRDGVPVDDAVLAVGDPTITYAVTDGTLPAGLSLDAATGAVTGTPLTAGAYSFTITASNGAGSITATFEGEVASAPDLGLHLDFAPGTSIEDAASTISAEGLLVGSEYTLTMFSTPRVLYTGIVGASGSFTWVVALPADTPAGAHRLLLTGTAASGAAMSAQAWFSLLPNGTIGAVSYSGPVGGALAATGAEPGTALLAGGMLLGFGVAVVAVRRRRVRAGRI